MMKFRLQSMNLILGRHSCTPSVSVAFHRPKSTFSSLLGSIPSDEHSIPTRPLWSVTDLLASYPRPTISSQTFDRIHILSALIPPAVGTAEHEKLTAELEELVKLVEAVKLVDKDMFDEGHRPGQNDIPDGRIWDDGAGIDLSVRSGEAADGANIGGRALLSHAARTANSLYVVEADKPRTSRSQG